MTEEEQAHLPVPGDLERARGLLATAERLLVLTGAGVSAESGVPTFRGPDGLWRHHRPEELATPEAFAKDPRLVWEWYGWRRERVGACVPNPAHRTIARLVREREGARVVTQNVDGLHERAAREARAGEPTAGSPSLAGCAPAGSPGSDLPLRERPLELHGSLFRARCTRCEVAIPHGEVVDASRLDTLPRCPSCAGLLRPDVVWFGEALDAGVLDEAFRLAEAADVALVVGTSSLVQPAASLPLATLRAGGKVVEVNPDPTPLTRCATVSLRGRAGSLLPGLLEGPGAGAPSR